MLSHFRAFGPADRSSALTLLDANIPAAFHPDERGAFEAYLDRVGAGYTLVFRSERLVAGYGLSLEPVGAMRVNWFMAHPHAHGAGLGREMMEAARQAAWSQHVSLLHIAASHVSEAFYAHFGAVVVKRTPHGWGRDMHRVDMEWHLTKV